MIRRLAARWAAILAIAISLRLLATMTRISEVDFLTGARRTSYGIGPCEFHGSEREEPCSAWARGKLSDPTQRHWVFVSSGPVGPFSGLIACGMPFNAVRAIWRLDAPDAEKDALLREWHVDVDGARDRLALRGVESRWKQKFGD